MNPETGEKPNTSLPPGPPSYRRYLWPAYRTYLRRSTAPIVVGPWRGEVGFEILYWLPWLQAQGLPVERLIPITRGGMGALYGAPTYLELYAMRSPAEIRIENRAQHQRTRMLKQMTVSPWDRDVIRDAAETLKLRRYHVLHPSWMYQSLAPFWDGHRGTEWLRPRVHVSRPPVPSIDGLTLPEKYVAVRFYARATFPMSAMTADIARETIKHLAKDQPVILLNAGLHADDHVDFEPKQKIDNVFKLSDLVTVTPENNLAVQAAVIHGALGFVGTYGGLAQMALRYQKPSISLYTDWGGTMWAHRTLSEQLATALGVPFHVQRVADLPVLQQALPRFVSK